MYCINPGRRDLQIGDSVVIAQSSNARGLKNLLSAESDIVYSSPFVPR